ncbi:hypothetical protein [Pendulispora albinea]|uniref:Uncharacterized protein n=1 Tax=Pendulispora albinea TaxID=2741071 RepID=A0ABZ2LRK0_9BACT
MVRNDTVPGVAPPATDGRGAPRVVQGVLRSPDSNPRVPRELPSKVRAAPARKIANATVPGLGIVPSQLRVAGSGALVDGASTLVGMPPPSDPFVENAVTAPITPKSGAPMPGDPPRAALPPDPDDLVRGLERGSSAQTPVAHTAESRGRDGAVHVAVVQPAPGQVARPAEPLVVVDVSTDPTSRSLDAIVSNDVARNGALARGKATLVVAVFLFGVCLILAVGILGTLAAKYIPDAPAASAAPAAAEPRAAPTIHISPAAAASSPSSQKSPIADEPSAPRVPAASPAAASPAAASPAGAPGSASAAPHPSAKARAIPATGSASSPSGATRAGHVSDLERSVD